MKKNNTKSIANEVIELEINALRKLKKSISNSFDRAVHAIVKCQSKVILCGVGKSFLIASKISSTLSSVGSPSFALPANECAHGDLGSISKKDVLILGEGLHTVHPVAGQGFNLVLRDIKKLQEILKYYTGLGMSLKSCPALEDFTSNRKAENIITGIGIDLTHNFFKQNKL